MDTDTVTRRPQERAFELDPLNQGKPIPIEVYQELFRAAGDAIVVIDNSGLIVSVNDETLRTFGYDREELIGQKLGILLPVEIRTRHERMVQQFLAGPEKRRPMSARPELAGIGKGGNSIPVEITISKIDSVSGVLASAIIRDVSLRRKIERELHETMTKLQSSLRRYEELDQLKNQLLGMAAHDLRNPLNRIGLGIQLLDDNQSVNAAGKKLIAMIRRAVSGMSGLINDLLDINRIEQGKIVLKLKDASINDLVREQVELAQLIALKKGIHITLELPESDFQAAIDADRLQQVVENLLSNAIKFSNPGSPVKVSVTDNGNEWGLSVIDHGPGLSDADQQRLFMPFSQLSPKPTAGESSTGLGLAISKRIVELHRGRLSVLSKKTEGSEFHFVLPKRCFESCS